MVLGRPDSSTTGTSIQCPSLLTRVLDLGPVDGMGFDSHKVFGPKGSYMYSDYVTFGHFDFDSKNLDCCNF